MVISGLNPVHWTESKLVHDFLFLVYIIEDSGFFLILVWSDKVYPPFEIPCVDGVKRLLKNLDSLNLVRL
jgi:hypothetical protein